MTRKTSDELADMIAAWVPCVRGASGRAFRPGRWMASLVIGAPAAAGRYQPLAHEIAVDLRRAYDLNV
jgi:hypothetical protein